MICSFTGCPLLDKALGPNFNFYFVINFSLFKFTASFSVQLDFLTSHTRLFLQRTKKVRLAADNITLLFAENRHIELAHTPLCNPHLPLNPMSATLDAFSCVCVTTFETTVQHLLAKTKKS